MSGNPPTSRSGKWRIAVAWAGTVVLLTYIGLTTDLDRVWEAFLQADPWQFAAVTVGFTLLTYLTDSATVVLLLRKAGFRVQFWEFTRIKAVSYLLNVVNYNLALAMMAAAVSRRSDKGLAASGSPFLLLNFADLTALSLMVAGGLAAGASPFEAEPTVVLALIAAGGIASIPVLGLLARLDVRPNWMGKLLGHGLLSAFRLVRPLDLVLVVFVRGLFILEYVFMGWCFLTVFHFDIPFSGLFVWIPILSLLIAIPISVAGLGTAQVVMREFYGPYAGRGLDPVAAVDAYSTASIAAVHLLRMGIGLACMRSVTRALSAPKDESP